MTAAQFQSLALLLVIELICITAAIILNRRGK